MRSFLLTQFYLKPGVLLVFFLLPCLASSQSEQIHSFVSLEAEEFIIRMNLSENEVLIDVRTVEEFKKERIPNAIPANNSKKLFSITDTLDLEQPLFIYCDEESRSITACKYLQTRGFKYVYFLKDGIVGWKRKNLNVDKTRIKRKKTNDSISSLA